VNQRHQLASGLYTPRLLAAGGGYLYFAIHNIVGPGYYLDALLVPPSP
jgi:hypothetical protein